MNRLQVIANLDEEMIIQLEKPLVSLPMRWNQRFRDSAFPGSEAEGPKMRKSDSNARPLVPRSVKEADNCNERDDDMCVLTESPDPQAAHIFPHCMLQPRPKFDRNKLSSAILDFRRSLSVFWGKDQVNKWKSTIFPDSQNPDVGVERCFNLISLSLEAHDKWNKGLFALEPVRISRNKKTLIVQFFWQVPGKYKIDSDVDLLAETPSSKGLDLVERHPSNRLENDGSTPRIYSGETFTFTTKDPENLPLPSMELLKMQWVLQRLVGMSGAAGWPSLDEIDDDSVDNDDNWLIPEHTDYSVHKSLKRVHEWVTEEAAGIMPEMFTPEMSTATPSHSVITCH